jgi:hypothetical protein
MNLDAVFACQPFEQIDASESKLVPLYPRDNWFSVDL